MELKKEFNKLCDPAKFYLLISLASVVVYIVHLMGKDRKYYSQAFSTNGAVRSVEKSWVFRDCD